MQFCRKAGQQILNQWLEIIQPFSERRHCYSHNPQPVIKILTKCSRRNRRFQIPIGGGNDPYIHIRNNFV